MPRGGRRTGTPGASYSNRTDLNQPVRTAPGQPYGQAGAQADAQHAVPLPQQAAPSPAPMAAPPAAMPDPGMLHGPTTRPSEPVTTGLPIGPGAGPEAMNGAVTSNDQTLAALYRAYSLAPTPGLAALIAQTERLRGPTPQ